MDLGDLIILTGLFFLALMLVVDDDAPPPPGVESGPEP